MRDFTEKGQIAPGEGERRAMRGYVPQYKFAARLIYDGLVSGKLQWVGLADRTAGAFDDVVLGLQDRVVGYQVKSSREPEPFRCRDLLLGAQGLLDRFVETSIKLRAAYPGKIIQIAFVTDNFPSTADNLGAEAADPISSSAFLRLHDARGNQWSLEEWRSSPFQKFIDELLKASGLSDEEFSALWKGVIFQVGGTHRYPGGHATTPFDDRRLADLSALLPRLVADRADRDRWTAEELLDRLRWPGPFNLRHEHAFPVDSLVQSNPITEVHLKVAFDQVLSGYVSLVGPPGSGKSTLLQAGLLPIPRAIFIRYLAFLPNERHGLGRAEAFDLLYDLVSQFKKQGLGDGIFPGSELPELRSQLEGLLKAAGDRFQVEDVKTIIVIDGLDHVPREERPEHSFLRELPLPASIPTGVIFVLGTQRLDLDDIPPAVRDQAKEVGRQINIAPLPREAVYRLAEIAAIPDDVDRSILYERSEGHPLSVRYLVEALLRSSSEDERKGWLAANVAPGRDVTKLYVRAWHDLENQSEAKRALAYVALIEGAIASIELDKIVGSTATDAAFRAAAHLLKIDARNRISIFHNSFRLFLLEQTNTRLGRLDHAAVQLRYSELADMAKRAEPDDPQRWMELRYRARAKEIHAVLRLAAPRFFRSQFADGRNPGDIHDDIRLAFGAVRETREPEKLFELLLCRHEIEMRADAISVEALLGAYIATGQLDVALGLIAAEGLSFPVTAHYPVVDALLSDGRFDDARRLFEEHEPIEKLLGSEPVDVFRSDEELPDWADHVLIFREPRHFLASLERLRKEERGWAEPGSLDDLKDHLKVRAARSRIEQAPERDFKSIVQSLEVDSLSFDPLRILAAEAAYDLEREDDAIIHLKAAVIDCSEIHVSLRRRAARLALALSQRDLAEAFFSDVPRPDLIRQTDHPTDWFVSACREVLIDGEIEAQLSVRAASRQYAPSVLLSVFQHRLETLGALAGTAKAGKKQSPEFVWAEIKQLLILMWQAASPPTFDSDRWEVDKARALVAQAIVKTAWLHGDEVLKLVVAEIDTILGGDAGQLGGAVFRRAYALAVFELERDTAKADLRLKISEQFGGERTPQEYVQEVAELAETLGQIGSKERACELLRDMHNGTLGVAVPAKKDAQYELWRDVYRRACAEDPGRRPERVMFFCRLLNGLSQTEGSGAARRVSADHLVEAAQCEPKLAAAAGCQLENDNLVSWATLLGGIFKGLVRRRQSLASACGCIFGRLALPFMDEFRQGIYPELLKYAPEEQRASIVANALKCIEVDADASDRVPLLKQLSGSAAAYGAPVSASTLLRWQDDHLPKPPSRDENPYEAMSSLRELANALSVPKENDKHYDAVRAFQRLAGQDDYAIVEEIMRSPEFLNDERAMTAAALAAVAAGKRDQAQAYADRLRKRAEESGSWGQWQGGSKFRLHQILIELESEPARQRAFDAFAKDLSDGREWTVSLLPDLADVFDLLSPRPSWARIWDILADHLAIFRDYEMGQDLQLREDVATEEQLIAEFLFQAIDLMTSALSWQVRIATRELIDIPGGSQIVVVLVDRLMHVGGDHAVEGARIAWEAKHSLHIRQCAADWREEWVRSDDLAILKFAGLFANELDVDLNPPMRELAPFYSLALPPDPLASNFDHPTGFTASKAGLWTEDAHSWTWPLERPLKILARATRFDIGTLRRRIGEFMRRNGGKSAFGPEAVKVQLQRLRDLDLEIFYRRLAVVAAFRAVREVGGELALANEFDPAGMAYFLSESGGPSSAIMTAIPNPRPVGLNRSEIVGSFSGAELDEWLNVASSGAKWPAIDGWVLVASAASFDRTSFRRVLTEETLLLLHDDVLGGDELDDALFGLPQLKVVDRLIPLYDGFAHGGVASARRDIADTVPDSLLALCPRLAEEVGLVPDQANEFSYVGATGNLAVRTIWWRDGGVRRHGGERPIRGEGCVVVASAEAYEQLRPYLGQKRALHVWRHAHSNEGTSEHKTQSYRELLS